VQVVTAGLRLALAALFLATGAAKALDLRGFAAVIAAYRVGFHGDAALPVAAAIALLETAIGAWPLTGRQLAAAVRASIALNVGYALLLASALALEIRQAHPRQRDQPADEISTPAAARPGSARRASRQTPARGS
jgi:hypothetical protein